MPAQPKTEVTAAAATAARENELGTITRANDVGTFKDVKPGHQTENESSDSIYGQL